uniref:Vacuolar protein sorting-associated protein 33A n=1 Tax=Hydatigena taeniaeformis TaxID=6205 RepID=A0A0R3WVW0_HYDTA
LESAAASSRSALRLVLAPTNAEKLANATERLIKRRKSAYKKAVANFEYWKDVSPFSHLHRQLQLSVRSQASLGVDKPAVSPSYVFGGQHVPVVVRLAESLWADGLAGAINTGRSLLNGTELLGRDQLSRALALLRVDERGAKTLGRVSLAPTQTEEQNGGQRTLSHGQTVVVAFVGGCTYAEVAALRFAAARRCWRLLIATSQILSTKSLIHQVGQAAAL